MKQRKKTSRSTFLPPWLAGLLCAMAFFVLYLFVFRPGYQVDDDITMIQMVSGYLGGQSAPFMVFSNVALGFLLNVLYRLPTNLNWEILIFFAIHFLSVWSLVYIVFALPLKTTYKLFGILVVLLSDSLFLLNITFTTTATFAVISGFISILVAAYNGFRFPKRMLIFGGLLILAGSLIRIESFLLVLLLIFPALMFIRRFFHLKNLVISSAITILVVGLFYLFNTLYVKSFPQWDAFYKYNDVRSQLQDTPRVRLSNMKDLYTSIGWNFNDYRLFMSWFFPDEQLYSSSNLQHLVDRIPGTEKNIIRATISYFYPQPYFDDLDSLPYFFLIAAGVIALMVYPSLRKAIFPITVLLLTFLVLIFSLIWTQKVPLRVWDSFLATVSVFGLFFFIWTELDSDDSQKKQKFGFVVPTLLGLASLLALYYAFSTTRLNIRRQDAYRKELFDLNSLQVLGMIQSNALIIAPANGIPLTWSNPMFLDLPNPKYMEMGWLTFSPSYYNMLNEYNIPALPAGFYQNDNVYLMVKSSLRDSVAEFFADHYRTKVVLQLMYSQPNYGFDSDYNNVKLYKLILQK
jgi:hypothetical protein